MTEKMLLHPGDPFPALTEIDVTVIAPPADDHATTQELIARHGLRFPAGHGAGASGIAGAFVNRDPLFLKPAGFVPGQDRPPELADRDV